MMVRRRVADLWRQATVSAAAERGDWAALYQELLGSLARILAEQGASGDQVRAQLQALLSAHSGRRPPSRAHLVRERLIEGVRPVPSLLTALVRLPWQAHPTHPVLEALGILRDLYAHERRSLPDSLRAPLGRVWHAALTGADRERAFCAFEVATLFGLRRALRNGTVWFEHSLAFRSREQLFLPTERWQQQRRAHLRRLRLPTDPSAFLEPLGERAENGLAAVAAAAEAGASARHSSRSSSSRSTPKFASAGSCSAASPARPTSC